MADLTSDIDSFDPTENNWQGVTLSDTAVRQILKLSESEGVFGLRLGVRPSGCAGFAYDLKVAKELDPTDLEFGREGAKLFVPISAMPYLDGTEVDFVRQGLNQTFQYNNPKVQNACGCGESFNVS